MPRYLDIHRNLKGMTLKDMQVAHAKDLKVQSKFGVEFLKLWFDEENGIAICLSNAPDREAPSKTHGEAHGFLPIETFEVQEVG